jgi:hypothetical protein
MKIASRRNVAIAAAAIFLVAFGVRLLSWHDTRRDIWKVQTVVAQDYQRAGRLFRDGGVSGFFSRSGPLADPNLLGHPPGYPTLIAITWSIFGESDASIQFLQITLDSLAAVLVFLIALQLVSYGTGVIAGALVALAPQFAWNSVLLLPDTLAVLPLLVAVYFLARSLSKPNIVNFVLAGAFVGLSCWLRANALLMAPFLAVVVFILFDRKVRLRFAATFLAGALLIIAPITIRNWIVFHHFVPVSLGAGQTMLEGIADYDPDRRFGIPNTDMGIMKMEAEQYNRPDYYSTLFAPDGIKRDRMRVNRAFTVIRNSPGWFLGVMVQRAGSMLRLERARLISTYPAVTSHETNGQARRVWTGELEALISQASEKSANAQIRAVPGVSEIEIISDDATYGRQFRSAPIEVRPGYDHALRIAAKVLEGRMTIDVVGVETGRVYASAIVEKAETKDAQFIPSQDVKLFFVSGAEPVSLAFNNAAPESRRSVVQAGVPELTELGSSSFLWTHYPRFVLNAMQRLFITAVMLPLALAGIFILVRSRAIKTLILLLAVPVYYLCFQSLLHTEYRYVLAIHYCLFVFVGVTLEAIGSAVVGRLPRIVARPA